MLIGWGMRDFVFDPSFLDEWRARFPHSEVHRFENAGHYVLEDASDELIGAIIRFLRRTQTSLEDRTRRQLADTPGEGASPGQSRSSDLGDPTRVPQTV